MKIIKKIKKIIKKTKTHKVLVLSFFILLFVIKFRTKFNVKRIIPTNIPK